jgi:hypothetical protein
MAALYHGEMLDGKRQFIGQQTSLGEIRDFFSCARGSFGLRVDSGNVGRLV